MCRHCLQAQVKTTDTAWGRVVKRYWWPLIGCCPGKPTAGAGYDMAVKTLVRENTTPQAVAALGHVPWPKS